MPSAPTQPAPSPRRSWRYWLRVLHRDIGYVACVLTIVYCVSGIAVNHVDDWNPNYDIRESAFELPAGTGSAGDGAEGALAGKTPEQLEAALLAATDLDPAEVQGRHRLSPTEFKLFLPEGGEVRLDLLTGKGASKRVRRRLLIFESNVLHLNHVKGAWTWIADLFALALLFLAASGLFMLKGKLGLAGRGKWFVAAGALLPAVFVALYYLIR